MVSHSDADSNSLDSLTHQLQREKWLEIKPYHMNYRIIFNCVMENYNWTSMRVFDEEKSHVKMLPWVWMKAWRKLKCSTVQKKNDFIFQAAESRV